MKFILAALALAQAVPAEEARPIHVMVVGSYHFANPGRDVHNMAADDVLTPEHQRELDAMGRALAAWKPTKVMIEQQPGDESQLVADFSDAFDPAILAETRNERIQIGYRVAGLAGVPVYAIDEQPSEGEPNYFPVGSVQQFAMDHGMEAEMQAMMAYGEAAVAEMATDMKAMTIPAHFAKLNTAESAARAHAPYLMMMAAGDTEDQPGPELYAYWMMRNAKIFGKAMQVAEPGDRVLIVYGMGHSYWLRHFAAKMPGYRLVESTPWLEAGAKMLEE
ncbi:DUF5694 domain-containing protein [Sphingomicrobium nitratireducens]|uniref:DUF5694 domain-containing protein n=1 Tax=Sphingomicrobium nitratireducens TaxID=2964666 RepID=UPI002240B37D|nr:DUF5694 domain-containing protein [Sphingomicrobium nitratireducens]